MRVKIGNYPRWFGPYQLAQKLLFWVPKTKDKYGIECEGEIVHRLEEWLAHGNVKPKPEPQPGDVYSFLDDRPVTWLYRLLSWIHSKQERNIKVHIDPWDTWSMDRTLAHIILPMLRQLKETKHGAPFVDDGDVPNHLKSTAAPPLTQEQIDCGEVDALHHDRWDWALDEMIFAFESKLDDSWEDQFESGRSDIQFKQLENGMSEMVRGPNDTKQYDWEGRKKYENRMQNGFRLFGKYYQSLWS
jgi:hypothetical protein